MRFKLNKSQYRGLLIYPLGDAIAQLILGDFNWIRTLVLAIVGCFLYSFEISKWFSYIDRNFKNPLVKTFSAIIYFNPLWIARHFLFIELSTHPSFLHNFSDFWAEIQHLVILGTKSFAGGIIISGLANYIIQNKISLKNRFLYSAIFSALMAIYYALSKMWF